MRIIKPSQFVNEKSQRHGSELIDDAVPIDSSTAVAGSSLTEDSLSAEGSLIAEGSLTAEGSLSVENSKKEFNRLYAKGVRLLAMREHSVKEITSKLSHKASKENESMDLVYAVIDELLANNYLSDQRFAESYVRSRQLRGFGPTKIRNELLEKGIKNNLIDQFIDANSSVWYENAGDQYRKKYRDQPVADYNDWTKRARFMQSRGFSMDHIRSTIPPIESD